MSSTFVAILMGSDSDLPVMQSTISILKQSIGLSTPNIYLDGSFLSSVIYNVELTSSEVADNLTYNQTI